MTRSTADAFAELAALNPAPIASEAGRDGVSRSWEPEDELLLERILATPREQSDSEPALPRVGRPRQHRWPPAVVLATAIVMAAVAAVVWVALPATGPSPTTVPSAPPASPSPQWRLAAYLSGAQFQLATGNPGAVVGVVCAAEPTCFLSTGYGLDYGGGGGMYVSHDGGHTWQPSTLPPNVAITTLASCASRTWCAAGAGLLDNATGDPAAEKPSRDPELMVTTDAGATWTTHPIPIPVDVQQLPAYGNLPAETTYWPGQVDAVSCSAPGTCNVVGHTQVNESSGLADELVFLHTTDGGGHWASTVLPEESSESTDQVVVQSGTSVSMACPTAADCVVLGSLFPVLNPAAGVVDAWRTTDSGQTWQEYRLTGVTDVTSDVSCPDVDDCWAGPAGAVLLHSQDGGASWSQVPLIGRLPAPANAGPSGGAPSLSCLSNSVCYLSSSGIAETTDGGTTWKQIALPSGVGFVEQVSCNVQGTCVAIAVPAAVAPGSANPYNGGSLILTDSPPSS
jgi:hypothetical protein